MSSTNSKASDEPAYAAIIALANSAKFRGIRPLMYIKDLLLITSVIAAKQTA